MSVKKVDWSSTKKAKKTYKWTNSSLHDCSALCDRLKQNVKNGSIIWIEDGFDKTKARKYN
jgi:hypothetical protein